MFKQSLIVLVVVVGLVASETTLDKEERYVDKETQTEGNVHQIAEDGQINQKAQGIVDDLKTIGSLVTKHGQALAEEARPAVNNIGRVGEEAFRKTWSKVMENEKARMVLEEGKKRYQQVKPHAEKAASQLITEGKKHYEAYRPIVEKKATEYATAGKQLLGRMISNGREWINKNMPATVEVNGEPVAPQESVPNQN